jgi:hypothetical protein
MTPSKPERRPGRVADLTPDELRTLIGEEVEGNLMEMFGDPDAGLELRPEFIAELRKQQEEVAACERGTPLSDVLRELHLD